MVEPSFGVRGLVEGFYGPPWSQDARLDTIAFLATRGMNSYVYAPKDEPKHRLAWRVAYDATEMQQFRALAEHGAAHGVRIGFAISPGLDVDYGSRDDRAQLVDKCAAMLDTGITWFLLALDDIPMSDGLAVRQRALANDLLDALRAHAANATLFCCPTEYLGTHPSTYLHDLDAGLHPDIDLVWTGPTVCSPTIAREQAHAWRAGITSGRGLVLWDNVPVNDGSMATRLHLGPYEGRDPALASELRGVLCNPMTQARASWPTLATAMAFLRDPEGYDAEPAWADAIDAIEPPWLPPLAAACADGPMRAPEGLALRVAVDALGDELGGPGWIAALGVVATELRAARDAAADITTRAAEGDPFAFEVRAWGERLGVEADVGLAAARLVQQCHPVAVLDDGGRGRAVASDAMAVLEHAFGLAFRWAGLRGGSDHVVFGPRFAIYPAIVAVDAGVPAFDAGAAIVEDGNAVDTLCRLALSVADEWRMARTERGAQPVRAFADGTACAIDTDGSFDAASARMVLVREGVAATRVQPGVPLPFRDPRLA